MQRESTQQVPTHKYADAVHHYRSPRRRDAVKRLWEEPFSRETIASSLPEWLARLDLVSVLDLGCGTGNGYGELRAALGMAAPNCRLRYIGLDNDAAMLAEARRTYADTPDVLFVDGDLRRAPPSEHFDIVYSCGVPLSHVTEEQLRSYLARCFKTVQERQRPTLLFVDVLGRYSMEWTTKWSCTHWDYRMSFFQDGADLGSTPMTFYDSESLGGIVRAAAEASGCAVENFRCVDRSIAVGRHMTTGEFNQGLPDFRTLINGLYEPSGPVDADSLRFPECLPDDCPESIGRFFSAYRSAWNYVLETAPSRTGGPEIAEALRKLECALQPGLGVGHTLIGIATVVP